MPIPFSLWVVTYDLQDDADHDLFAAVDIRTSEGLAELHSEIDQAFDAGAIAIRISQSE